MLRSVTVRNAVTNAVTNGTPTQPNPTRPYPTYCLSSHLGLSGDGDQSQIVAYVPRGARLGLDLGC